MGHIIPVVMARRSGTTSGEPISAGLGWMTAEEGGIFVEHTDRDEEDCRKQPIEN
ncbi:pyruvoyl-dependent arginine decarboxylase [Halorubrum sp. 2020YC2]|nr:pyruvoyl-dependent arginine decarboxylase [Halorubrum sp. 2020YC2]